MENKSLLKKISTLVRVFAAVDRRYRAVRLPLRSLADLDRLPVMTRTDLKAFATAPSLSEAFNITATSGSTSSRLLIAHSQAAHQVHLKRLAKIYRAIGAAPGTLCLNLCSYDLNSGGRLMEAGYKAAGAGVIPLGRLSSGADIEDAVRLVRTLKPTIVNAYTNQLPDLFGALGRKHSIRTCVVNGELLWPSYRARIEKMAGVRVHDHYGAMEVSGFAIARRPDDAHMTVFSDGLHLEVQREDGVMAGEGTGDLLVTDLENTCMPFIRYRLGDRVDLVRRGRGQAIRVLSRTEDSLLVNGVVVMKSMLVRAVNDLLGHPRFFFRFVKDPATYKDTLTVHVPATDQARAGIVTEGLVRMAGIDRCVLVKSVSRDIPRMLNGKINYFIRDAEAHSYEA